MMMMMWTVMMQLALRNGEIELLLLVLELGAEQTEAEARCCKESGEIVHVGDDDANQKNDDRLDSPQRVDQSLGVFQLCPQPSHLGEKNLENKLWKLMVITIKMILNFVTKITTFFI